MGIQCTQKRHTRVKQQTRTSTPPVQTQRAQRNAHVIRRVCVFVLAAINAPLETQCQIIQIDADMQCSEVYLCACVSVFAGLFVLFLSHRSNQM